jgi:hypothetical protein
MKVGTKSLLFGVHQFVWHPFTVWRAWRHYHKRTPTFWETVAIVVHDWGYWGCDNMDGEQGITHPDRGALFIYWLYARTHSGKGRNITQALNLWELVRCHSSHHARNIGGSPSALCAPDKLSVLFDPPWWYLLRGCLSGEIGEYITNSPAPHQSPERWLLWYRSKVKSKY